MPRQTSVQLTEATERQTAALKSAGFGSLTDIIRIAIDRMYQQEKRTMNSKQQFPRIIYASPADWGNVTEYASAAGMERTIEALVDAFDEPFDGTLGNCDTYELVSLCNGGSAAYRQQHVRDNKTVAIFKPAEDADYFECVEMYDTDYDSEELAGLGVSL